MNTLVGALILTVVVVALGAVRDAAAQAPPPAPIEGPIYSVTYVEALPSSGAEALALLRRYRDVTRQEDGSLRCEVVSRPGQSHQLVILEVWRDRNAFEAHARSASTVSTREKLHAIRSAPLDERVHVAASVGPLAPGPGGDAVYVVTHVDVIPPRKDDGLAALRQLAAASRSSSDNLRFEIVQQTSRPNHFTVIEIWKDAKAVEAHASAEATRRFRDALGPMSGALYDERMLEAVD